METLKRYENYPIWVVILSNLVSLAIYGLGFLILIKLSWIVSVAYLFFVLILEYRLIKDHCANCYYWGKNCGFGRGKVSALLFKRGDISRFCNLKMTWKDMVPDLLVTFIPIIIGIFLLIANFNVIILIAILFLIILTTIGNGFIRKRLTCKFCKQRDLGCPADILFNKGKR